MQEWIGFAVVLALSAVGWLLYRIGLDRWGRELRRLEDWGHAPVECSRGTLRKKRSEEVDRAHPSRTKIIYQGVFRLEDGKRIVLTMEKEEFDRLREGDTGEIVWQGLRFHSFE